MNKNNKHEKENDHIQEHKNNIQTKRELELKTNTTMGPRGPMGPWSLILQYVTMFYCIILYFTRFHYLFRNMCTSQRVAGLNYS